MAYGCFPATPVGLSSCNRDPQPTKPNISSSWVSEIENPGADGNNENGHIVYLTGGGGMVTRSWEE